MTDERRVNLAVEWHGDMVIVTSDLDRNIPPVSLAVFVDHAYVQTYLTMDEAARLGKALLDAATEIARAPPAEVRPGVDPDIANALETFADAAAAPGSAD
jgi:hypothetical protein